MNIKIKRPKQHLEVSQKINGNLGYKNNPLSVKKKSFHNDHLDHLLKMKLDPSQTLYKDKFPMDDKRHKCEN